MSPFTCECTCRGLTRCQDFARASLSASLPALRDGREETPRGGCVRSLDVKKLVGDLHGLCGHLGITPSLCPSPDRPAPAPQRNDTQRWGPGVATHEPSVSGPSPLPGASVCSSAALAAPPASLGGGARFQRNGACQVPHTPADTQGTHPKGVPFSTHLPSLLTTWTPDFGMRSAP